MNLFRFAVLASTLSAVAYLGVACAADSGAGFGDDGGDDSGVQIITGGIDAESAILPDAAGLDSGLVAVVPDGGAFDAAASEIDGGSLADGSTSDAGTVDTSTPEAGTSDVSTPDTGASETGTADVTVPDTSVAETSTPDTSVPDTNTPDTSTPDTSTPDTSVPDTSTPDTSVPDTSTPDTSTPDTSTPDTSTPDTSTPDTSAPDTGGSCLANIPAACPNCQTQNANDEPICEMYIACYMTQNCNPADPCGANDGPCGVNKIGGGEAPQTAAIATYNCACP